MVEVNLSIIDMLLEVSEIPESLPADSEYLSDVDGVDAALPGLEGDCPEGDFFVEVCEIGCEHDVRQVEILQHLLKILLNKGTLHQPERCIRIRDADTEGKLKYEPQRVLDKLP